MSEQHFLPFYGKFIIHELGVVEWRPNPSLQRSFKEQFLFNMKNGHFEGRKLTGDYTFETMT